jgi:hypothetical protein
MDTVNRTILIVIAKQPMLDWLHQLPDWTDIEDLKDLTLESINEDNAAFLIPEFDTSSKTQRYIEAIKVDLFEEILCGWTTDEALWPKRISNKLFDRWFHAQFHTMVYDLAEHEPLVRDEDINNGLIDLH